MTNGHSKSHILQLNYATKLTGNVKFHQIVHGIHAPSDKFWACTVALVNCVLSEFVVIKAFSYQYFHNFHPFGSMHQLEIHSNTVIYGIVVHKNAAIECLSLSLLAGNPF